MKHKALEDTVRTAIAGELPIVLGLSGVVLDIAAAQAACDGLTKRVCDAVTSRGIVRSSDDE